MSSKHQLTRDEQTFFSLVRRAAFVNPFSDERRDIDLEIGGELKSKTKSELAKKAAHEVGKRISILEKEGRANINFYEGKDRYLLEKVFQFEFFYRYKDKFDQLIQEQIAVGDNPVKIPFLSDALVFMLSRGFSEEYFRRFFALGFQVRRAYYFIDRSLIGDSSSMKNLRRSLWDNVFTHNIDLYDRYLWNRMEDFSTLILGETGTGKGTAALAIGRSGFIPLDRRKKTFIESFTRSFVSLNLSQFPETIIESELFGHKKGAFTGAVEEHKGVFDRCSPYGAILLDEIGDISVPIQIKLLQVLQERSFNPVGSRKKSRFQGRVIAATNRSIEELRTAGSFRDDFYYRLCSDVITVPPLRHRIQEDPAELSELLHYTIERMVGEPSSELVEMVNGVIERKLGPDYPWPGNVRELEQCVRRVLLHGLYSGGNTSIISDLEDRLKNGVAQGDISAQSLMEGYCALLYQRHNNFEEVARRTGLDRRTVRKYILEFENQSIE